jgi:hypothetical protein
MKHDQCQTEIAAWIGFLESDEIFIYSAEEAFWSEVFTELLDYACQTHG